MSRSLIGSLAGIAVGAGVAIAVSDGGDQVGGFPVFAVCAAVAFLINWLVYIPSNAAQSEKFYDLTGSITYMSVIAVALTLSADLDARSLIVGAMVVIWAGRLGTFLFRRISREGKDGRFDKIKTDPMRFFMAWTIQGLWVLLTAAAALAIITGGNRVDLELLGYVGIAIWIAGFALEVIADRQKAIFRSNPDNEGRFISTGLWAWSRHPNYFGEIMLWTGIAVMAVPVLAGWQWVALISPVFVVVLLTRISGLPMLEARADRRWGSEEAYQLYKDSTPVLIPRPPRRNDNPPL